MSVVFIHDGNIGRYNGKIYSSIYNNEIVNRYKVIDNNVIFITRKETIQEDNLNHYNELTCKNFECVVLENFKSFFKLKQYFQAKKTVKKYVKENEYIVCRLPSNLGNMGVKYAKKYNKKYLVEVVGCQWDSLRNHSIIGKVIAPIEYLKQKVNVKGAENVLYVTEKFLQGRYKNKKKSEVCSDVRIKIDDGILEKRKKKIDSMKSQISIGTIGNRDMKYKGFDVVIKSLAQLNKDKIVYKYYILGSGSKNWIKKVISKYKASEYVVLQDFIPHEEIPIWLDNIDIYIQPSRTEGMPRALIEAMSRACPCIGSNVGGIPELLDNNYIFKKNNYKELKNLIEKFTKDRMKNEAEYNLGQVEKFEQSQLDSKRNDFFKKTFKGE